MEKRFAFIIALMILTNLTFADSANFSLDGQWFFKLDAQGIGQQEKWFQPGYDVSAWRRVCVPHTWQVEPDTTQYNGIAWYAREVESDTTWNGQEIQIEFDAVYRDAQVWVNGNSVGEHIGSGWTAFGYTLTDHWNFKGKNTIVVRVDNRFSENALPYQDSFDWAQDGGIIRSVRLKILPKIYIERIQVQTDLKPDNQSAEIQVKVIIPDSIHPSRRLKAEVVIFDPDGNRIINELISMEPTKNQPLEFLLQKTISLPQTWHFDQPKLYHLLGRLRDGKTIIHEQETRFGIRRIEVKDGYFFLNGEPMRLMGVEWMPGSDPRYGMAESPEFMRGILSDMKRLNCLLTRFHWQQDEAIFDFCDRNGMLVQEEVPAWGGKTMNGNLKELQERHSREMIVPHINHPSIYAWGLCNEIGGQSPEAHEFVRRGMELGRILDPTRLLTYASNSLQTTPEKDASGLVDFIEWNNYYESWYGGGIPELKDNLESIHQAFPKKTLVISEYGLCECSPNNPEGEQPRIRILKTHTDAYRQCPAVAGAIYFDYNDYRTHIGDKGQGAFKQRIHGVVDLLGKRKPSWEILRYESSPIRSLQVFEPVIASVTSQTRIEIKTRSLENDLPAYTLRDYRLIWTAYNLQNLPLGTGQKILPDIAPGTSHIETVSWPTFKPVTRVAVEIFRPTGYPVLDAEWKPQKKK